ncbi:MAG: hypothetical protein HQ518_26365 [Rhodopirellula sp.]|nr:hypothetical protein [Rhodopirellula sp.]
MAPERNITMACGNLAGRGASGRNAFAVPRPSLQVAQPIYKLFAEKDLGIRSGEESKSGRVLELVGCQSKWSATGQHERLPTGRASGTGLD